MGIMLIPYVSSLSDDIVPPFRGQCVTVRSVSGATTRSKRSSAIILPAALRASRLADDGVARCR